MLHIYFGRKASDIDLPGYFDDRFENSWIDSDFSRRVIKEIDKSTVIRPRIIESPILGDITPKELSGGTKSLILMMHDESLVNEYFPGEYFGNNTLPFVLEIARTKEVYMDLVHIVGFPEDMTDTIFIDNFNRTVTGYAEWERLQLRMDENYLM